MSEEVIPVQQIATRIRYIRGQKVLLDFDLAQLYGVSTKVLNQAVKRNRARFPEDFMFQLTRGEAERSRSQIVTSSSADAEGFTSNWSQFVTSSKKHRGAIYRPFAFTEQGVAMLSSVLRSDQAVKVNIAIMRAFVKLREAMETNRELARRFSELEQRVGQHDEEIASIIEVIRQLVTPPDKPPREIGFHVREKPPRYRTRSTKR